MGAGTNANNDYILIFNYIYIHRYIRLVGLLLGMKC